MSQNSVSPNGEHSFADDTVQPGDLDSLKNLIENRCASITARLDEVIAKLDSKDLEAGE